MMREGAVEARPTKPFIRILKVIGSLPAMLRDMTVHFEVARLGNI